MLSDLACQMTPVQGGAGRVEGGWVLEELRERERETDRQRDRDRQRQRRDAVSYTHLTLPTNIAV